ncbi:MULTISPECIES: DNA-binding response regulator [unclassified Ornithinimicrobium]|uniref:response regulator transcription factor n=1 Tax=unclassified Ornithinimicrobium TaxID=2615080 RepID=UPI003852F166
MPPVTVALRNDYEVVVRGLERMLEPFADRVRVVEMDLGVGPATAVDVTLHDTFSQPQVDADDIDLVLGHPLAGRVVVYSWNVQPALVRRAIDKGCAGYVDKSVSAEELVSILERVATGEVITPGSGSAPGPEPGPTDYPGRQEGLSPREAEVVVLITQGLTNDDIARRAYLSINTVKSYIRSAYQKMGVVRRSEAVRWGMEHGMLPDHGRAVRGEE